MFISLLFLAGLTLWLIANLWLKTVFLNNRLFWTAGTIVVLFLTSFFLPQLFEPARIIFLIFSLLLITDVIFLFAFKSKPIAKRTIAERMSNGDKNPVGLQIKNSYPFTVKMRVINELPDQFQSRNNYYKIIFKAGEEKRLNFSLRPVERGEYHFGNIFIYAS